MTTSIERLREHLARRLYLAAVQVGLERPTAWGVVSSQYLAFATHFLHQLLDTPTAEADIEAPEHPSREPTSYAFGRRLSDNP